jgi:tryptophan 2-monooxygenase
MSIHKQLKLDRSRLLPPATPPSPWLWQFPNTADFNFNYYHLLDEAASTGIGTPPATLPRIAIVGCGIAGLTAARELFRSGYTSIDLYESTNRLGGRNYSVPAPGQHTVFELGAMRLPYFSAPGSGNCVLDYYTKEFSVTTQPFPDPGSPVANTGIYLNDGYGPAPSAGTTPELLLWETQGVTPPPPPPTPQLEQINAGFNAFALMFQNAVSPVYATAQWEALWQNIVSNYWEINFRDFVYLPAITSYDPATPGYFGGLGFNETQAQLLYTIGVGDGSWGAFYDISSLYVFRTILFGFGDNHQLIQGLFDGNGNFLGGPQAGLQLQDTRGNAFLGPNYLGVQTFADCMFFQPVTSAQVGSMSLYDAMFEGDVNLYTSTTVSSITKNPDGSMQLTAGEVVGTYDAVIVTPSTWALQIATNISGFDPFSQWPFEVQTSFGMSHWIRSCKVMYPLTQRYWEASGSKIPQLLSTDTVLQGVYAYALQTAAISDPGVILVSYTWEDDANKFLAQGTSPQLGTSLLSLLDDILVSCPNIGQKISPYVDTSVPPTIIQWSLMPSYLACAKLYHERSWDLDYALLRYNEQYSAVSGLYFAGEGFSVEGGWTEPALRGGLDAVIHVINNTGGGFTGEFTFASYPLYTSWSPAVGSSSKTRQLAMQGRTS